jgi:exopolyphosphatase/pppGpp-phosphohydrolase
LGPDRVWSRDAGALRITRAFLDSDPPSAEAVARARREIHDLFHDLDPARPDVTLAVGGTARAVGRVLASRFGVDELERLTGKLSRKPAEAVAGPYGVTPERAQTLLGGTLVLAEIARLLDSDLEVGRGGLREGAALALARPQAAAA